MSSDNAKEDNDSASFSFAIEELRKIGEIETKKLAEKNKEKQLHAIQMALLDEFIAEENKVAEYFKRGVDTALIGQEIRSIEEQYKIATRGIFIDSQGFQTMRNLSTSVLLMNEIETTLKQIKKKVEAYLSDLEPFRNKIDSLQNDTLIYKFPKDSALFMTYWDKLLNITVQFDHTDSLLTNTIKQLRESDNYITTLQGKITTGIELTEDRKQSLAKNQFSRELNDLFKPDQEKESITDKADFAYTKAGLVLNYYFRNNLWRVFVVLFAFVMLAYFILKVNSKYKIKYPDDVRVPDDSVFRHPLFSSAFMSLMILQFIFPHPPVVFSGLLWILSSLILTLVLWKDFSGMQRFFWIFFVTAFIAVLLIDLNLKESQAERWLMLVIALLGIAAGFRALKKNMIVKENRTIKLLLLAFSMLLMVVSVISNLFGRYNLSKTQLVIAFIAQPLAYLLYQAWVMVSLLLRTSADVYGSEGNQKFQERVQKIAQQVPVYLKYLLIAGWIILVARNFHFYDKFTNDLTALMEKETAIGNFTFSFDKLLLFVFIIILSTVISKTISFYADKADTSASLNADGTSKTSGLSNWMLLIRIAVISLGTLLAFAATGFPMDKMTIIIGSLGVGIGLGLQTIVNNLVSGILLAFEKPFKIGDYIEVSGEEGRVKEIGIRSSKLSTAEGADVIIPNGDLLSKHLTNWTMRNSLKRSELNLNIKYGSHLNEIKSTLEQIMQNNDRINKNPSPAVLLHQFGSGSAEYRLLYWTNIEWEDDVKSELIVAVEDELKKAGIGLE
jgi:small-conductance mechanosensitive channel